MKFENLAYHTYGVEFLFIWGVRKNLGVRNFLRGVWKFFRIFLVLLKYDGIFEFFSGGSEKYVDAFGVFCSLSAQQQFGVNLRNGLRRRFTI